MNQRWAENRYRHYPFDITGSPVLPFDNGAIVDASFRLRSDLMLTGVIPAVRLTSAVAASGSLTLTFRVSAPPAIGTVELVGSCPILRADDRVVPLMLRIDGTPHPEYGYGTVVLGDAAEFPDGTSLAGNWYLDPSTVRVMPDVTRFRVHVGNLVRPQATLQADGSATVEPPVTITIPAETPVSGPYVHAATPTPLQMAVQDQCPEPQLVATPVPPPTVPDFITLTPGSTVEVTRSSLRTNDSIPVVTAYQGVVIGVASRVLQPGYNLDLRGAVTSNRVELRYRLGAGLGVNRNGVGYAPGWRAVDTVRRINGSRGRNGDFTIEAGTGFSIVADAAQHRLFILVGPENITRAAP